MRNFFCFRTRNRTGRRTARGFAGITILRVLRRGGIYAARCSPTKKCGIAGKPHGTVKTVPYKPVGNAEPSRDCAAIKIRRAVGAGHAPPAVLRLQQHNGSSVGAAYMPPVAANPSMQPTGKTPRDAYMRPLQTYRKSHTTQKGQPLRAALFVSVRRKKTEITFSFPRPSGRAGPRRPAYTGCPGRGRTCRSRGGSCRDLPPTAGGRGRGEYSPHSRNRGRRAGSQ